MGDVLHDANRVPGLLAQTTSVTPQPVPITADAFGNLGVGVAAFSTTISLVVTLTTVDVFTVSFSSIQPVQSSFSYANITTNTTTAISTSAGVLHGLIVNTGATTSKAFLFDGLTSTGASIATANTTNPVSLAYDVAFSALTVATTGVGAADLTVSYR